MTRVLHVIEDYTIRSAGVFSVLKSTSNWLEVNAPNFNQNILSTSDRHAKPSHSRSTTLVEHSPLGSMWCWSKDLAKMVSDAVSTTDVVHIHGVWMAPQFYAQVEANSLGVGSILSPHGMLEPWLWRSKGIFTELKKRLYWRFLASPRFRNACIIHAITEREQETLHALLPKARIAVIPNAVDLTEFRLSSSQLKRRILFLGRIHPVKGIDILIEGFFRAQLSSDWELVIAGPIEDRNYFDRLNRSIARNRLDHRVSFVGPVYGEEKRRLLSESWVVVVPSHTEVIGMINLESAACRTPSLTTPVTGLSSWATNGGVLVETNSSSIGNSLRECCSWSESERYERGARLRRHIEDKYSLDVVGPRWMELYSLVESHHL